jgi:CheY-like chemotaxis protein
MGGKLELDEEYQTGSSFFFTLELEQVKSKNTTKKDFKSLNVLVINSSSVIKKQEIYLFKYLDFFNVNYEKYILKNSSYDLIFLDYDYLTSSLLVKLKDLNSRIVLIIKPTLKKKIEELNLEVYKIIYEPLNSSKIQQVLYDEKSQINISKKHILVAEDNPINQKIIQKILEDMNFLVNLAADGEETINMIKTKNYDLIFMDIKMPKLDGIETTKAIREYEKINNLSKIPIIALSANSIKNKNEFLDYGFDEYITKPIVTKEIIKLLNKFL